MKGYALLKLSPLVLTILAWLSLGLGLVSAVTIIIGGGSPEVPRAMSILSVLVGILYWFFLIVAAQAVNLLLEIKDKVSKSA